MAKSSTDQQKGDAKTGSEKHKREGEIEGSKNEGDRKRREEKDKGEEKDGEGKAKRQRTEGSKVKQVTFLEPEKDQKDKGPKKEGRKRTKRILHELKSQMEFYFGDSNLSKDRFMKQEMEKDPEGYVPLSLFMNFGKIKDLASNEEMLAKALKLSSILQMSEDGSKVQRTTPVNYLTKEETDARTVYVEGFHKFISHEWIEREFSKCGKVTYISLPRFKNTKEIKGYAFVEFETPEQVEKAVEMLNCVPDEFYEKPEEKVAASVKQSKNLTYWKRRATKEGINPAEVEAMEKECSKEEDGTKPKPKKKKKRNRASVNQGEGTSADPSTTAPKPDNPSGSVPLTEESKENAAKQDVSCEMDDSKTKKSKKSKKKRKRKASLAKAVSEDNTTQGSGDAESTALKSVKESESSCSAQAGVTNDIEEPMEESTEPHRKRAVPAEEEAQSVFKVPKVNPTREGKKGGEDREETAAQADSASADGGKKAGEISVAAPSSSVAGQDSEAQKVSGRKRKARESDNGSEQATQSDASHSKKTVAEGDLATDTSDTQERTSKKRKADTQESLEEKPAKMSKEGVEEKPAKMKKESMEEKPAEMKKESVEEKPAKMKKESVEEKPAKMKKESVEEKPAKMKKESVEEKPAKMKKESVEEKPAKVKKERDGRRDETVQRPSDPPGETGRGEGRKRQRKNMEGEEEGSSRKRKKPNVGSGSEAVSEAEVPAGKKRRRRKHKAPEPVIRLRVMTKEMWSQLKKEYLQQQKVNMRKLKDQLQEASRKRREKAQNKQTSSPPEEAAVESGGGRSAPVFVPNVILEVKSEAELCLQTIKADIPPAVGVAYVDIRPGMTDGYIRCKDPDSASQLLTSGLRGLTLSLVKGEAETQYWNKLISDRESKLSDGKRKKRRGKLKILQRAQNPQEESQRQHVIFAEDGTEVLDRSENPEHNRDDFNAYSHRQRPPVW